MEPTGIVPTVDDLRVKMCYICREEEQYDQPHDPAIHWVHPCKCTLVAHESCLLNWIQSSQQDASRAPNALKCPQCGTEYEIESENPRLLRLMNKLNSLLSGTGKLFTVAGMTCVVTACGFGIYIILTSYGAFAVKQFIGQEMFDTILTDDPSNWSWHAFINLPLVPISLILSRVRLFDYLPIYPLLLVWTSSPPVSTTDRMIQNIWSKFPTSPADYPSGPIINWPPSPVMTVFLYPVVANMYRIYFKKFRNWVMGTDPEEEAAIRRVVWALNNEQNLRVQVDLDAREPRARNRNRANNAININNNNNNDDDDDGDNEGAEEDLPQDAAAVAERTIRVTSGSLGRFVGGALLIPTISNIMGSLLYRLSKHSILLRRFLAIQPPRRSPPVFRRWAELPQAQTGTGLLRQLGIGIQIATSVICGGTKTFAESDPVWWRNTVGLGLFVFAKDCVNLLHLYLTKREIESRKVKNRSFEGIDLKELDLINPPQPSTTIATATSTLTPIQS
ncbi:hypothetical protein K474DRAFT_1603781 [Panus rudis PR-1116 ss-1]|nr:hypothetical protein K474DRAFT_1603781 [Panus rudis PR-1116 ss-1]